MILRYVRTVCVYKGNYLCIEGLFRASYVRILFFILGWTSVVWSSGRATGQKTSSSCCPDTLSLPWRPGMSALRSRASNSSTYPNGEHIWGRFEYWWMDSWMSKWMNKFTNAYLDEFNERLNERMDDELMNAWMNEGVSDCYRMNEWMNALMNERMYECMNEWMDEWLIEGITE